MIQPNPRTRETITILRGPTPLLAVGARDKVLWPCLYLLYSRCYDEQNLPFRRAAISGLRVRLILSY